MAAFHVICIALLMGANPPSATLENWDKLCLKAVYDGDIKAAEAALKGGANARMSVQGDFLLMHLAVYKGQREIALLLEQYGAAIDAFSAAGLGRVEDLALMLKADSKLINATKAKENLLIWAVRGGGEECISMLIDAGLSTNSKASGGDTLIHLAIKNDSSPKALKLLLNDGDDKDTENARGWTPLLLACHYGNLDIVHILVSAGCSLKGTREVGSPLALAARSGRFSIIEYFLDNKLSQDEWDEALLSAARFNQYEICRLLLRRGVNVNCKDREGQTPLHLAAQQGHFQSARVLLSGGANPDVRDLRGYSPAHDAVLNDYPRVITLLAKYGATLKSDVNDSPLDYARVLQRQAIVATIEGIER